MIYVLSGGLEIRYMVYNGTQVIRTARLTLRPFVETDGGDMLRNWIADPEIQYEYGEPVYTTEHQVQELLHTWICRYNDCTFYRWAIVEDRSRQNIGQIAFCRVYPMIAAAEIEYCIGASFQGNGYAAEALEAVIAYALYEDGFQKLEAYHREENRKSGRVLEKSSMRVTDTIQRFIMENKKPEGEICYCICK